MKILNKTIYKKLKVWHLLILVVVLALPKIIGSDEEEYYNKITKGGEISVYFMDHTGTNHEIYWYFENGKIEDYYSRKSKFASNHLWDARLVRNINIGLNDITIESPENFGKNLDGNMTSWKHIIKLKFPAPKVIDGNEYECSGSVRLIVDGGNNSYDADFIIKLNEANSKSKTQQQSEETIQGVKAILDEEATEKEQPKEEKLQDGKYCFQFDDLVNSGEFYYADVTIQNSDVLGNLTAEYESGDGYSATFIGTIEGNQLNIKVSYDNDGGGPYEEKWKINSIGLTLEQPAITLTNIKCD